MTDEQSKFSRHFLDTKTAEVVSAIVAAVCVVGSAAIIVAALMGVAAVVSIDQVGIALTGVVAVFLTQSKRESRRRWACVFGTLGQPFWIYAAISAHQLGVLLVSVLYTFAWAKGVWTHWIRPRVADWNHPLAKRAYVMSEPHLGGFRVIVGFEDRHAANEAHDHIATIGRGP